MVAMTLTALATSAGPVAALTLEQCNRQLGTVGSYHASRHALVGTGIVSHVVETCVGGDCTRAVVVTACASGKQINARSACEEETRGFCAGKTRKLSQRDRVQQELKRVVDDKRSYSFDDMALRIGRKSLGASVGAARKETCGCAAAFPAMRNGKKRFRMETFN
ncbi:hypothetical protein FHY55_09245 [Oceanicola sp. D3]|uniref:hypothetical protein n=1 Tax=Oceanicola sp. D3 TaxID=2587163 RepID=UPI00111D66C7|nr:hypothetical protein [Oceanicola sp. D3]QDC09420.1 hypothetical protein FHY55_09245 [Oceanicola sp. D3]